MSMAILQDEVALRGLRRKSSETMSKRIRTRVGVHRRVEYRHARRQGDGMLMDLSLQGCQIKDAAPFESGTRLRLQLWLPDQARPVKVE